MGGERRVKHSTEEQHQPQQRTQRWCDAKVREVRADGEGCKRLAKAGKKELTRVADRSGIGVLLSMGLGILGYLCFCPTTCPVKRSMADEQQQEHKGDRDSIQSIEQLMDNNLWTWWGLPWTTFYTRR